MFAEFRPEVPAAWRATPVLFLANIDPKLQSSVRDQVTGARLVAADTMNYWIESKRAALIEVLSRVNVFFINDGEIRQLTGERNLVAAARRVRAMGPSVVVVKRGEHGVLVFENDDAFALPAYPLDRVLDPTGAGDAFAGGFLGYLASTGLAGPPDYRRAAVVGSVMASYQVEDFSLDRLKRLEDEEIRDRYARFERLTRFGPLA